MNTSPHTSTALTMPHTTDTDTPHIGADTQVVAECTKRILFVTGEQGCGKSTFLAALIQKYALKPSGFITKKEAAPNAALYMHPIVDGTAIYRYTTGNCVGICRPPKPIGFASVFDDYGVMCLKQAEKAVCSSLDSAPAAAGHIHTEYESPLQSFSADETGCSEQEQPPRLPVIVMDELGVMEAEAELFFRTVCDLFFNAHYYIIGVVKPRGTRFLPVLEQMPEAAVLHLTLRNRAELYRQLERAYSFAAFLAAAGTESAAR